MGFNRGFFTWFLLAALRGAQSLSFPSSRVGDWPGSPERIQAICAPMETKQCFQPGSVTAWTDTVDFNLCQVTECVVFPCTGAFGSTNKDGCFSIQGKLLLNSFGSQFFIVFFVIVAACFFIMKFQLYREFISAFKQFEWEWFGEPMDWLQTQ